MSKISKPSMTMSWPDRLALIDHFNPADTHICAVFKVTPDELKTARELRDVGTLIPTANIDATKFNEMFSADAKIEVAIKPTAMVKTTTATTHSKPETASKKVKEPKKRGRHGNNISTALLAIPSSQVSAEDFCKKHNISLAVLRQSKRFIKTMEPTAQVTVGKVNVRQDKTTKVLMVWREDEAPVK